MSLSRWQSDMRRTRSSEHLKTRQLGGVEVGVEDTEGAGEGVGDSEEVMASEGAVVGEDEERRACSPPPMESANDTQLFHVFTVINC